MKWRIQRVPCRWGRNSTGSPNFIRRRGRNTMTPCLGGRNSTWKICWILSTVRWIKTPRVEIQWGQNSILHRLSVLSAARGGGCGRGFPSCRWGSGSLTRDFFLKNGAFLAHFLSNSCWYPPPHFDIWRRNSIIPSSSNVKSYHILILKVAVHINRDFNS